MVRASSPEPLRRLSPVRQPEPPAVTADAGSRRPSQPTPAPYVPRSPRLRDPDDVDAAMDDFEKKVAESKRAKDVLRQLKATIDGVPDAEVDVASCLSAIKTAAAYSPPESSLNELLRGTDPAKSN